MARPRKWTDKRRKEVLNELDDYIRRTEIPILAEFAAEKGISRQMLYEWSKEESNVGSEFADTIKRLADKKQAVLEKKALNNEVNSSMAIFSLKQHGWSDKSEQNINHQHSGKVVVELPAQEDESTWQEKRNKEKRSQNQ